MRILNKVALAQHLDTLRQVMELVEKTPNEYEHPECERDGNYHHGFETARQAILDLLDKENKEVENVIN